MPIFTTQSNELVMKNKQKMLLTSDPKEVNKYLDKGWEIVSVTAQVVSSGGSSDYKTGRDLEGKFAIVIQKLMVS